MPCQHALHKQFVNRFQCTKQARLRACSIISRRFKGLLTITDNPEEAQKQKEFNALLK